MKNYLTRVGFEWTSFRLWSLSYCTCSSVNFAQPLTLPKRLCSWLLPHRIEQWRKNRKTLRQRGCREAEIYRVQESHWLWNFFVSFKVTNHRLRGPCEPQPNNLSRSKWESASARYFISFSRIINRLSWSILQRTHLGGHYISTEAICEHAQHMSQPTQSLQIQFQFDRVISTKQYRKPKLTIVNTTLQPYSCNAVKTVVFKRRQSSHICL